jgi:hypothetical protein
LKEIRHYGKSSLSSPQRQLLIDQDTKYIDLQVNHTKAKIEEIFEYIPFSEGGIYTISFLKNENGIAFIDSEKVSQSFIFKNIKNDPDNLHHEKLQKNSTENNLHFVA